MSLPPGRSILTVMPSIIEQAVFALPGSLPGWVRMSTDEYGWVRMGTDGYGWVRMGTDGYGEQFPGICGIFSYCKF